MEHIHHSWKLCKNVRYFGPSQTLLIRSERSAEPAAAICGWVLMCISVHCLRSAVLDAELLGLASPRNKAVVTVQTFSLLAVVAL